MIVSAQIAIYPLRQDRLTPAIAAVTEALAGAGLAPEVGPMSTKAVFGALQEAFARTAATGHVVMTVTVSNACPPRA